MDWVMQFPNPPSPFPKSLAAFDTSISPRQYFFQSLMAERFLRKEDAVTRAVRKTPRYAFANGEWVRCDPYAQANLVESLREFNKP